MLLTSVMLPIVRSGWGEFSFSAVIAVARSPRTRRLFGHSSGSARLFDTTAFGSSFIRALVASAVDIEVAAKA